MTVPSARTRWRRPTSQRLQEIIADLRAGGLRTWLILVVLTAVAWSALAVNREATRAQNALAGLLTAPENELIRITSPVPLDALGAPTLLAAAHLGNVRGALALGQPDDGRGSLGAGIVVREVWGDTRPTMWAVRCESAQVDPATAGRLGLADGVGRVTHSGIAESIDATRDLPPAMSYLRETVLIRRCSEAVRATEFAVLVSKPVEVPTVTRAVTGFFPIETRTSLTIRSAETAIDLARQALTQGRDTARRLTLVSSLACGVLAALLFGMITVQRRRDYGRRRALGATPGFIVALVVGQAALITGVATLLAVAGEATYARVTGQPALVRPGVFAGTALMLGCAACLGALLPAVLAAKADPVHEVRVP